MTPNDLGTPTTCGGGNIATIGSPDPTNPDAGAKVEVRDGTTFKVVSTIEVPLGATLMPNPPAVFNPLTGETTLLSGDLTELTKPLDNPSGCILRTLNGQIYCEEEGQLRRVTS